MAKREKGSNGQDSQSQADDNEDDDLEGTGSQDGSQNDENDEEDESEEEDESGSSSGKPTGSDLDKLTPEQKNAEIVRLRAENSRRRIAARGLRDQLRDQQEARKGKKTPDELERENGELRGQVASLTVGNSLRDYIAEKHPEYAKLSKRIAKFVDLEDVDLADPDSVRDAVESAVEDFVKEVPIGKGKDDDSGPVTDANGRPVGAPGGSPSRRAASDTSSAERRKKMFPTIYSGTKA